MARNSRWFKHAGSSKPGTPSKSSARKKSKIALLTTIVCISVNIGVALATTALNQSDSSHTTVIGEVTSIDMNANAVLVRTDDSRVITLSFAPSTRILKVQPSDTSLRTSSEITLSRISIGDRLSARGLPASDRSRISAEKVIVMSRSDIQKKLEQQQREWTTRSIAGVVRELKPESSEITIDAYGPTGRATIVVQTAGCQFRRYSSRSVKFSDSGPGAFSDVKVGDQLRALGTRAPYGSGWKASEIVSGSFQTLGGTVTSVDPQKSEIKITVLGQKRDLVVEITPDSVVKRLSPQAAMIIAQRAIGVRPAPQASTATPRTGPASRPSTPAAPNGPNPAPPQAPQLPDSQQIIDSLPLSTLSGIKPGDVIAVTSAAGDGLRVSAIKLVAGVDLVINAINARAGQRQMIALSAGLPLGIFDYGITPQ